MNQTLVPASELAARNPIRFPNETAAYRLARNELLAAEIELRRQIERVAAQRRALPPGGEVTGDFRFDGEQGEVPFAELFAGKQTLVLYSYMFGPERARPCPMCTSLIGAFDGEAADIAQRVGFAVIARSPLERLQAMKRERGWRHIPLYADVSGDYTRAYVSPEDGDISAFNVFTRQDGTIRHFWSSVMFATSADPGQDPRVDTDVIPLWRVLVCTPEGRGTDWYPLLVYGA
jgi:predicted dithiol-disulfide oxidoreductase (DUF899 family)